MTRQVGPFELFDDPHERTPAPAEGPVLPAAPDEMLSRLGRLLPAGVFLGTSSWSFAGWERIVYGGRYTEAQLARSGLAAYAAHPLLRAVGIDRGFYQPLAASTYAGYARQVPDGFRFVVKAPSLLTSAATRAAPGATAVANPHFLDAGAARATFIDPALEGLGSRCGPLVFQFPPLPRESLRPAQAVHALIARIGEFLALLPQTVADQTPVYAVELRDPELLTPRFVAMLRSTGTRLCLGVHARMPEVARQATALRKLDAGDTEGTDWRLAGPLVVRWNLHAGFRYEEAKSRYAPFDRLIDPDIVTRGTLAHLVHVAMRSAQPAFVIVNNKAEGSAPLSCIELARAVVGA
ncbi:MAG TPA: DUF72 domain-containing protein [Burkholderiaceae bacterium]|nr:DUF72 domain-containing protein [Burkholderiaceae bacterium]